METLLNLIEGQVGALIMVISGLAAAIAVPVCAVVMLIIYFDKEGSLKSYVACASVPVVLLATAVGMFFLRAFLAVFFVTA